LLAVSFSQFDPTRTSRAQAAAPRFRTIQLYPERPDGFRRQAGDGGKPGRRAHYADSS
jgi:hypothetical protein